MAEFKIGDKAEHQYHGTGMITQISPTGKMAVVKYPTTKKACGYYHRTHFLDTLKKVSNGQ